MTERIEVWGCIVCANIWAAAGSPLIALLWLAFTAVLLLRPTSTTGARPG